MLFRDGELRHAERVDLSWNVVFVVAGLVIGVSWSLVFLASRVGIIGEWHREGLNRVRVAHRPGCSCISYMIIKFCRYLYL